MGLWQKTMFYLGLVDEDRVGFEEPAEAPRARPEPRRQVAAPAEPVSPLRPRRPVVPFAPVAPLAPTAH